MTRFKAGDTITNGKLWHKVSGVRKSDYQFDDALTLTRFYMPITIVDRLWTLATDNQGVYEGEIVDDQEDWVDVQLDIGSEFR